MHNSKRIRRMIIAIALIIVILLGTGLYIVSMYFYEEMIFIQ